MPLNASGAYYLDPDCDLNDCICNECWVHPSAKIITKAYIIFDFVTSGLLLGLALYYASIWYLSHKRLIQSVATLAHVILALILFIISTLFHMLGWERTSFVRLPIWIMCAALALTAWSWKIVLIKATKLERVHSTLVSSLIKTSAIFYVIVNSSTLLVVLIFVISGLVYGCKLRKILQQFEVKQKKKASRGHLAIKKINFLVHVFVSIAMFSMVSVVFNALINQKPWHHVLFWTWFDLNQLIAAFTLLVSCRPTKYSMLTSNSKASLTKISKTRSVTRKMNKSEKRSIDMENVATPIKSTITTTPLVTTEYVTAPIAEETSKEYAS